MSSSLAFSPDNSNIFISNIFFSSLKANFIACCELFKRYQDFDNSILLTLKIYSVDKISVLIKIIKIKIINLYIS